MALLVGCVMRLFVHLVLFAIVGGAPAAACTVEEILNYGKMGLSPADIENLCPGTAPPDATAFTLGPAPMPVSQGILDVYTSAERIAPLTIVTPSGLENYYVKVVDAYSNATVLTAYILGGGTLEIEVPTGSYRLRYATGQTWYGSELLFGDTTAFAEADKTMEFSIQDDQVSGYTIELIKQVGGNLETRALSRQDF
jgi:hypothetical protein